MTIDEKVYRVEKVLREAAGRPGVMRVNLYRVMARMVLAEMEAIWREEGHEDRGSKKGAEG